MARNPNQISFRVREAITGGLVIWEISHLGVPFCTHGGRNIIGFGFFIPIILFISLTSTEDIVKVNRITRVLTISRMQDLFF